MSEVAEKVVVRSRCELDALVAKSVMGWELDTSRSQTGHWKASGDLLQASYDECGFGDFSPANNIADAWQVVEKVAPRSHVDDKEWIEFALSRESHLTYVEICKCELYDVAPEHQRILGTTDARTVWRQEARYASDTIAICLAALKTVGIEVKLELNDAS